MRFEHSAPATAGILVVDDEEGVRQVICRALRVVGYTVHHARNGEEAAAVAAGMEPLALALVDVALGEERGPAIVKRLLAERPSLLIAYISGQSPEDLADAAGDGGARVLPKPFGADEVVRFVREMLQPIGEEPDPELRYIRSRAGLAAPRSR